MYRKVIPVILVLALANMACSFSFSIPKAPTPGPDVTDKITVAAPTSGQTRLTLSFGAGELTLSSGAKNLVEGTATYNIPDLKPEVTTTGNDIEVKQGNLKSILYPDRLKNKWDLKLGNSPMDLTINAGAYNGTYDFGGVPLTGLTIKDGASNVNLKFSQQNPGSMAIFHYETGASTVKMYGLANANFDTLIFKGGAGDYTLDFSGTLKRDATITIDSGLANVILVIPDGVKANVTVESGVSNVNTGSNWSQNGSLYSQTGSGPTLTFVIKTGAGNLTLTH